MKNENSKIIYVLVLAALALLAGLGWLVSTLSDKSPEVFMGTVIVLAISILMVLLFILSAGFNNLKMSDAQQALGLPKGSVRALIALFLIMVFIIFGLYLFREVVGPKPYMLEGITETAIKQLEEKGEIVLAKTEIKNQTGIYNVVFQSTISEQAERFADRLMTTIGTLLVAIAGFYFGNRAVAAALGEKAPIKPEINSINPQKGEQGKELPKVVIIGENFNEPKTVELIKGVKIIPMEDIKSNPTEIHGKLNIPRDAEVGKWDLRVVNKDGGEQRKSEIFEVVKPQPEEAMG